MRIFGWFLVLPALCIADAQALTINIINQNMYGDNGWRFVSSEPYANQKLEESPTEIQLNFSQPVNSARSVIRVIDQFGMDVSDGETAGNGRTISTSLPDLPPGRYRVKWRVRCACDEMEDLSDSFRFTVLNPKP